MFLCGDFNPQDIEVSFSHQHNPLCHKTLWWRAFAHGDLGDPAHLHGRRDLLPNGATLAGRHADYESVRGKLINCHNWLRGYAKDNREFIELEEAPTSPQLFPPPVPLPHLAPAMRTNESPSSIDAAIETLGSDWATTKQLATLLGTTEGAIRGKIRSARKSKNWMRTLNEHVLEHAGQHSSKAEFRVRALWPFLNRSRARAQE